MPADALDARWQLERDVRDAEGIWRRGDWPGAFDAYRAIAVRRLIGHGYDVPLVRAMTAADLAIFDRLAMLCVPLGHARAAAQLLSTVADACDAAGNAFAADWTRLRQLQLALSAGDAADAALLLATLGLPADGLVGQYAADADLRAWEHAYVAGRWPHGTAGRASFLAALHLQTSKWLASNGHYAAAARAAERGLSHAADADDDTAGALRLQRASIRIEQGQADLPDDLRADPVAGPPFAPAVSPGLATQADELRGRHALIHGDFGAARRHLARVVQDCETLSLDIGRCGAMLNLARVLIQLNQSAGAQELVRVAQASATRLGHDDLAGRAVALANVVQARLASPAESRPFLDSVETSWAPDAPDALNDGFGSDESGPPAAAPVPAPLALPRPESFLSWFDDHALHCHQLLGRRQTTEALDLLADMRRRFGHTDSTVVLLRLEGLQATADYHAGRVIDAAGAAARIAEQATSVGMLPEAWQALRLRGWCARRLGTPDDERDAFARAADDLLDQMAATLPDDEAAVFRLNKWNQEEDYLVAELNRTIALRDAAAGRAWPFRWAARRAVQRRVADLVTRLDRYRHVRLDDEGPPATPAAAPNDTPAVRSRWRDLWRTWFGRDPARATIGFLVLPDRVVLVRRFNGEIDLAVRPTSRLRVRELVKAWHQNARAYAEPSDEAEPPGEPGDTPGSTSQDIVDALAAALGLPEVLDTLPPDLGSLTFVPDDVLHGFPFAAVRYRGQYLIEHCAISIAYRLDADAARRGVTPWAATPNGGRGLLVGVTRGDDDFDGLPDCGEELDRVDAWLTRRQTAVTMFRDDRPPGGRVIGEADRDGVLRALPDVAFLHIACHGLSIPGKPQETGLVLLPGGRRQVLSTADLRSLHLPGLGHATLSSCWAADNFVYPGRWVISLPETLIRAGAKSVMACLWQVDDRLGSAFVDSFYTHLDSHPPHEALRLTQLDFLRQTAGLPAEWPTSHALSWAGFQLYR